MTFNADVGLNIGPIACLIICIVIPTNRYERTNVGNTQTRMCLRALYEPITTRNYVAANILIH